MSTGKDCVSMGFSNWSRSVKNAQAHVIKPATEEHLISFVRNNFQKEFPLKIRPFSAGHAYSDVMSPPMGDEKFVFIDLSGWKNIVHASDDEVTVQPGVLFHDLLEMLESKMNRTMENMTGCLNLSMGGIVAAASHGSGFAATIAEQLVSLRLLQADGSVRDVSVSDPLMPFLVGGMGAFGIFLSLTFRL